MNNWHRKGNVAHALPTNAFLRHLDTTTVTDNALVANALILAAVALPIADGTEYFLAEQTILLGTERPVVDRLRLRHLSMRPRQDQVGGCERDRDFRKILLNQILVGKRHRFSPDS